MYIYICGCMQHSCLGIWSVCVRLMIFFSQPYNPGITYLRRASPGTLLQGGCRPGIGTRKDPRDHC